ncbi:MAG: RagB/SusD family nutrient uptake outer membrane protein, partial [Spirochaetia bacterium]|nr:RagB/SusD family nutrient uptake outer membrane protein [Spirochaetia bacterium]
MKNKLIYTIALSLSLLLASCNDWLDVTPPSQIREEQQFSTVEGFQQALIGCYIGMTNDTLYGRVLSWGTIELMAGQFNPLEQYSSNDYYISNFNYTSDNALKYINSIWTKAYNSISNANNILKYAETNKSVLDNINYSIIKGEALAIRAYLHFDIMRLYGHGNLAQRRDLISRATIPYVTSLSKELTPQQPYGTTITNIIADLEEALQLLQIDPVTKLHDAAYYNGVN